MSKETGKRVNIDLAVGKALHSLAVDTLNEGAAEVLKELGEKVREDNQRREELLKFNSCFRKPKQQ